jgi:hypothetical protein
VPDSVTSIADFVEEDHIMRPTTAAPPAPSTIIDTAERATDRAEALALGAPITDAIAEARTAIERAIAEARRQVFPATLAAASPAALADFRLTLDFCDVRHESIPAALVLLHGQALGGAYDELAAIVRGPRGMRLVHRHETETALGTPGAAEAGLQRWQAAIAAQIAERPDHPLVGAARIVFETAPALLARLTAVEQRHAAHAAAEAERQRQAAERDEQARADAARAAERQAWAATLNAEDRAARDRRDELVQFYQRHIGAYRFVIGGRSRSAADCHADLLAGAPIRDYWAAQISGTRQRATASR